MKVIDCPSCGEDVPLRPNWPVAKIVQGYVVQKTVTGVICLDCGYMAYGRLKGQTYTIDHETEA